MLLNPVNLCVLLLCVVAGACLAPQSVFGRLFPESIVETNSLPESLVSAQIGDLDGDGQDEVITVSASHLQILRLDAAGRLQKLAEHKSPKNRSLHRIWLADVDEIPHTLEILVAVFQGAQVHTEVFQFVEAKLHIKQSLQSLVIAHKLQGLATLWGQDLHSGWRWSHQIQTIKSGSLLRVANRTPFFAGVGTAVPSLLALASLDEGFALLEGDGRLNILDSKGKGVWRSGMTYGGAYDYAQTLERDGLGISRENRFFIPPRLVYDSLAKRLYAVHNEGYVKNVIGAIPAMKWAQVSTLGLEGQRLNEIATLPRVDGAITDLQLLDFNLDGVQDLLITVLLRKLGMLDSLRDQESVLVVLPVGTASGVLPPPPLEGETFPPVPTTSSRR